MIRVELPYHLRNLARLQGEVKLDFEGVATLGAVLDRLEALHPALRGTMRDHGVARRRPFIRFFACKLDLSHEPMNFPLPPEVQNGTEPLLIVGAMAGG